jgi:hypothetical protein
LTASNTAHGWLALPAITRSMGLFPLYVAVRHGTRSPVWDRADIRSGHSQFDTAQDQASASLQG